jgi:hypothetical protein
MASLDGQKVVIDGETVRFKMWNGIRLYVNQRRWTLGYFEIINYDLSWGTPAVAKLQGNPPSPLVAQAVSMLLGIDIGYRVLDID